MDPEVKKLANINKIFKILLIMTANNNNNNKIKISKKVVKNFRIKK